MNIVIHTYGRPDTQKTWDKLPDKIKKLTSLVVQERERLLYKGYPIIVLPKKVRGLSPTRQWLIDNNNGRKLCMMDDDITQFAVKTKDNKLVTASDSQIELMFIRFANILDNLAHCGVPYRQLNRIDYGVLYSECTRMMSLLCYDTRMLKKYGCRFDRVMLKQDFDMTLQLLEKGFKNRLLMRYAINVSSPQNNKGGVTEYRTDKANTEAAYRLQELHPKFVKVVKKETKTSYGGGERTDVTIQWKKAYASSLFNRRLINV